MPESMTRIASLLEALLRRHGVVGTLDLSFGGCAVTVASNSDSVLEELRQYYGSFQAPPQAESMLIHVLDVPVPDFGADLVAEPPEPGKSKVKHEYVNLPDGRIIKKRATGMHFLIGLGRQAAVGPCRRHLHQVINFINTRHMDGLLQKDAMLCHASAVVWKGRGLAFGGPSGVGKSTLALHMVTRGAAFVSNDRVLLLREPSGPIMWGVPKFPRVNPGTLMTNARLRGLLPEADRERLAQLSSADLWHLEQKHDVRVDQLFGPQRLQLSAPLAVFVMLQWSRDAAPVRIETIDAAAEPQRLAPVLKKPGIFHVLDDDLYTLERLARHLDAAPVYAISGGGSFRPLIAACKDLASDADTVRPDHGVALLDRHGRGLASN